MALLPDVTALTVDPELGAVSFTILRHKGSWIGGRFVKDTQSQQSISAIGIIQPPSPAQLSFFPQGQKREGQIVIYTMTEMQMIEGEDASDDVVWRGDTYKVIRADRWLDYGFNIVYCEKR